MTQEQTVRIGEKGRKAIAMQQWLGPKPDKLKYEMIFTSSDSVAFNQLNDARRFIE